MANRPHPLGTGNPSISKGFTLLELMLAIIAAAMIVSVAVPAYTNHVQRAKTAAVLGDMGRIQIAIESFMGGNNMRVPNSLAEVNMDDLRDPWGNPYRFLNIANGGPGTMGKVRKDQNLVPINSDYDLYSMGSNGDSKPPLTAKPSRDDIVRANNGSFLGIAGDF